MSGEIGQGEWVTQSGEGPPTGRRRTGRRRVRHGLLDVLGLTAVAPGRHHTAPGHLVGQLTAVVVAQDVQTDVDAGGGTCGGEDRAVVHEEHVRVQEHLREQTPEIVGQLPVRGRPPPPKETRRRQHERARADGDDAGVRRMSASAAVTSAGSSVVTAAGSMAGITTVSAVRSTSGPCSTVTEKSALQRTGWPSTVQVSTSYRPSAAREDPAGDAQLEGVDAVQCQDDHALHSVHGTILSKVGNLAMSRSAPSRTLGP